MYDLLAPISNAVLPMIEQPMEREPLVLPTVLYHTRITISNLWLMFASQREHLHRQNRLNLLGGGAALRARVAMLLRPEVVHPPGLTKVYCTSYLTISLAQFFLLRYLIGWYPDGGGYDFRLCDTADLSHCKTRHSILIRVRFPKTRFGRQYRQIYPCSKGTNLQLYCRIIGSRQRARLPFRHCCRLGHCSGIK